MKYLIILIALTVTVYGAWDNDKPADDRTWDLAPGDIRDNNDALEVVMGVDLALNHPYFQSATPTFKPDGTTALDSTDLGRLWVDSDDNVLYSFTAVTPTWTPYPVTSAGNTWDVAQTWTLGIVANDVWVQSTDVAGTSTVNLIKADSSDVVTLADDTVTNTQSANDNSTKIATTAYADASTMATNKVITTTTTTKTTVETNAPASSAFIQSEGVEVVTVTISSLTVGDIIEVEGFAIASSSQAALPQIALFVDSISASIAVAVNDTDEATNGTCSINLKAWFTATGASHTFKMRAIGAIGTTTINNAFGGTATSWISATRMLAANVSVN